MKTSDRHPNIAGGFFASLIFLFVFGFFIGLPAFVWVLLIAAFIGLWVATTSQRAEEKQNESPLNPRPWRR
jgi:predicted lipid-binding transport protein (Tim44 family)